MLIQTHKLCTYLVVQPLELFMCDTKVILKSKKEPRTEIPSDTQ